MGKDLTKPGFSERYLGGAKPAERRDAERQAHALAQADKMIEQNERLIELLSNLDARLAWMCERVSERQGI